MMTNMDIHVMAYRCIRDNVYHVIHVPCINIHSVTRHWIHVTYTNMYGCVRIYEHICDDIYRYVCHGIQIYMR